MVEHTVLKLKQKNHQSFATLIYFWPLLNFVVLPLVKVATNKPITVCVCVCVCVCVSLDLYHCIRICHIAIQFVEYIIK